MYRRPAPNAVESPTLRPVRVLVTLARTARSAGFGSVYMTIASSFEKFILFETKGMSWRRMSPPPRVVCW